MLAALVRGVRRRLVFPFKSVRSVICAQAVLFVKQPVPSPAVCPHLSPVLLSATACFPGHCAAKLATRTLPATPSPRRGRNHRPRRGCVCRRQARPRAGSWVPARSPTPPLGSRAPHLPGFTPHCGLGSSLPAEPPRPTPANQVGSPAPRRPSGQPRPPPPPPLGRVPKGLGGRWGKGGESPGARSRGKERLGSRSAPLFPRPRAGTRRPRAVPVAGGPAAGGRAAGSPASRLGALPSPPHVLRAGSSALTAATAGVAALFTQTGARGPGTGIARPSHVS